MKHGPNTDSEKTLNRRERRERGAEAGAVRRMPPIRIDFIASAGLRPSRAPGKCPGRCGIPSYHASGEVAGSGKRRAGSRGLNSRIREERCPAVGKGGQETGKWCSFSHFETALTRLFPHNSTQVVDFPHLAVVRLFWGGPEIGFSGPKREVAI